MSGTQTERLAFVTHVRDALDTAGVEFAFLHNLGGADQTDSDVDVVVDRESLGALDTVVRSGALGTLLQRLDYDVPWCRYYILDTGEAARRFRQLDVACDPFGICSYGNALREALHATERRDGMPVLNEATTVVYLTAKRARKGVRNPEDIRQLRAAFSKAPAAGAALNRAYGEAGTHLARALATGEQVEPALQRIDAAIRKHRARPSRFALRIGFEALRVSRRVSKPTGLTVVLAGPDGSGKSTLADGLEAASDGLFRQVSRLHLTPGLLPPPSRLLRRPPADITQPHVRTPSSRVGSLARVVYLATDTLLGWGPRVAFPRVRSGLVLIERGWRDLEVDPRRYRLGAGLRVVRALARILPQPDLTLVLDAPTHVIHGRKPELDENEIARQLASWRSIASRDPGRFAEVEGSTVATTLDGAVKAITQRLRCRAGSVAQFHTALTCLGQPRMGGIAHAVVSGGGRPRWILPLHRNAAGPTRARLYRPASTRHRVGALMLGLRARTGLAGGPALFLEPALGLRPELEAALGLGGVELAAMLPTDPARFNRTVISILHRGRPVAMAKVAPQGSTELNRELRVLAALETCRTTVLQPPRLIDSFAWRGFDVLVTSALDVGGRTDRALGQTEEAALVELASLRDRLAPVLDGEGAVPVHGDFCGWNTAARRGRLAVWDWEWAHLGEPLVDWFHWQTQRLVHFGLGSIEDLLRSAVHPSKQLREFCARVGLEGDDFSTSLAVSLRHDLARIGAFANRPETELRRRALAQLDGRS